MSMINLRGMLLERIWEKCKELGIKGIDELDMMLESDTLDKPDQKLIRDEPLGGEETLYIIHKLSPKSP